MNNGIEASVKELEDKRKLLGSLLTLADPFAKLSKQQESLTTQVHKTIPVQQNYTQKVKDNTKALEAEIATRKKIDDMIFSTNQKFALFGKEGLEL